ncbi:MAG: hypothetical protein K9I68_06775 [Bacteroidales bacterium]|nr:hypothetical protein [Bacteroidales bacterium]MCF8337469.1 hypothetical protein [Bacteroidales bacterium]
MKKLGISIGLMMFLISFIASGSASGQEHKDAQKITVVSSTELVELTSHWATSFSEKHPGVEIQVTEASPKNKRIEKVGEKLVITSKAGEFKQDKQPWEVTLGRRAVVPVINSNNPLCDEISKCGVSDKELQEVLTGRVTSWGSILDNSNSTEVIHYLQCDEPGISDQVNNFLDIKEFKAYKTYENPEEFVSAVQNDPLAIGFCSLKYLISSDESKLKQDIAILPLDHNESGKIEHMEDICSDLNSFMRGLWIGKFPHSLCENIHLMTKEKPSDSTTKEFITFLLNTGQDDLNTFGFSNLAYSERQTMMNRLSEPNVDITSAPEESFSLVKIILIILVILFVVGYLVSRYFGFFRTDKLKKSIGEGGGNQIFDQHTIKAPEGLYFDKSHTWAFMEKNGLVRMGLDDFMQHVTGSLTRVNMKKPGETVKKGEPVVTLIQEGKQLTIKAPITGTIKEYNKTLLLEVEKVNKEPYNGGWIYLIEPNNWQSEIPFLKMVNSYREWLKNEFSRLKDFVSYSTSLDKNINERVVMQEGGALQDHFLEEMGPVLWEEFQRKFIDTPK